MPLGDRSLFFFHLFSRKPSPEQGPDRPQPGYLPAVSLLRFRRLIRQRRERPAKRYLLVVRPLRFGRLYDR